MLSKKEVKYIQSLCHKRKRDEDRVFVAEGPKMALEILNSDFEICKIYAVKEWIEQNAMPAMPVVEVKPGDLENISQLQTPNLVVVIAAQKIITFEPLIKDNCTLVLDGIQDPGNLGTIIRIADWFGIAQVVCSMDCADVYNLKVVQATMGSITRVTCWYKPLNEWLDEVKVPVYGALLQGDSIYETQKIKEGLLVIGNESQGIRNYILPNITRPVTIPKRGEAESLNAAVATGIILSYLVGG